MMSAILRALALLALVGTSNAFVPMHASRARKLHRARDVVRRSPPAVADVDSFSFWGFAGSGVESSEPFSPLLGLLLLLSVPAYFFWPDQEETDEFGNVPSARVYGADTLSDQELASYKDTGLQVERLGWGDSTRDEANAADPNNPSNPNVPIQDGETFADYLAKRNSPGGQQ